MHHDATSAPLLLRGAINGPARAGMFHRASAAVSGLASRILRKLKIAGRDGSAQDEQAARVRQMTLHVAMLRAEREILIAERARAKRQHSKVSDFDKRLNAVIAQLISLEGQNA